MEEGIVKIGDYGLAKLITPSQGTEHSESIGTCHYMAPEIGSGKYHKPIDVYAMGVILYEMLTGRVPFEGETVNEVLMKHLTARPDVSRLPAAVSGDRGQGTGQGPEPPYSAGFSTCCLPRDAPHVPDVRIIGDGKGSPGAAASARDGVAGRPPQDDVLRIEAEEPIFYIGPDTHPARPQGRNEIGERIRANWEALRRPRNDRSPSAPPRQHRVVPPSVTPVANGVVRQGLTARPTAETTDPTRGGTAAGAAAAGERPGPHRRTRRLDALGCAAAGASDRFPPPRSWASI